jgi:hypothetical protein
VGLEGNYFSLLHKKYWMLFGNIRDYRVLSSEEFNGARIFEVKVRNIGVINENLKNTKNLEK